MGRLSWPESITEFREGRIPDLLHSLSNRLLDDPVQDGGDPEESDSAILFVDLFAPYGKWLISATLQSRLDLRPVPLQVSPDVINIHPVNPGGAFIGLNLFLGPEHIPAFQNHFQQPVTFSQTFGNL